MKLISSTLKSILLCQLLLGLYACSGSKSDLANSALTTQSTLGTVYFDSFGKIPVTAKDSSYWIRLHNSGTDSYSINKISIVDDINHVPSKNLTTTSTCQTLLKNGECSIQLDYKANTHGAYRIIAEVRDKNGSSRQVNQIIVTGGDISNSAPINMEYEAIIGTQSDKHYSIAQPVYLNQDFAKVSGTNGKVYCKAGSFAGNSCTYFIDGKLTGDKLILSTEIQGFDKDGQQLAKKQASTLIQNQLAHLLISNPGHQTLELDNNGIELHVKLYNTGNQAAQDVHVSAEGASVDYKCSEIVPQGECSLTVKLDKKSKNGIVKLVVSYNKDKSIISSFSYNLAGKLISRPLFTNSIDFTNMVAGDSQIEEVILTNFGNTPFKILQIDHGDKLTLENDSTCSSHTILAPVSLKSEQVPTDQVKECSFKIKHTAVSAGEGFSYLLVTGGYQDVMGSEQTAAAFLPINYSGVDTGTVLNFTGKTNDITTPAGTSETVEVLTITNTNTTHPAKLKFDVSKLGSRNDLTLDRGTNACEDGQILQANTGDKANNQCSVLLRHNPNDIYGAEERIIEVGLSELGGKPVTLELTPFSFNVAATNALIPVISSDFKEITTSDGTPYVKVNDLYGVKENASIQFIYTLKNHGSGLTNIRNISLSSVPNGWSSSVCAKADLKPGEECEIILSWAGSSIPSEINAKDISVDYQYQIGTNAPTHAQIHLGEDLSLRVIGYTEPKLEFVNMPEDLPQLFHEDDYFTYSVRMTGYNPGSDLDKLPAGWQISSTNPELNDVIKISPECNWNTTLENQVTEVCNYKVVRNSGKTTAKIDAKLTLVDNSTVAGSFDFSDGNQVVAAVQRNRMYYWYNLDKGMQFKIGRSSKLFSLQYPVGTVNSMEEVSRVVFTSSDGSEGGLHYIDSYTDDYNSRISGPSVLQALPWEESLTKTPVIVQAKYLSLAEISTFLTGSLEAGSFPIRVMKGNQPLAAGFQTGSLVIGFELSSVKLNAMQTWIVKPVSHEWPYLQ